MGSLDDILIERVYSPLSGWLRHRLGVCQWRAAIECLNGSIAFYMVGVAFEIATRLPDGPVFQTMLRALVWLLIMDWVRRHAYRQAGSSVGVRTARLREWMFRLILVAVTPLSLIYAVNVNGICYSAALLLLICHLYFKASDTPPPEPKGKPAWNRA